MYAASGGMATPIVSANGIVYVGSSNGRWYALRATTGAEVFRVQISGAVAATASMTALGQLLLCSDDGNSRAVGP
jgi:outer membrane protein assembly factor BamB